MSGYIISAYIFASLTAVVIIFQLALALGAPWGEMAMGGKYPGRLPMAMRLAALVQIAVLVLTAMVVLVRAGVVYDDYFEYSRSAAWFVTAFCLVGLILNTITPSKKERMLWAPVTFILLVCSLIVAIS